MGGIHRRYIHGKDSEIAGPHNKCHFRKLTSRGKFINE
jgi:hypothetical protein